MESDVVQRIVELCFKAKNEEVSILELQGGLERLPHLSFSLSKQEEQSFLGFVNELEHIIYTRRSEHYPILAEYIADKVLLFLSSNGYPITSP